MKTTATLVVDDEQPLRDFVRRNLEIRGYRVVTAGNGLEGLALFNTDYIELVIMDVMMPSMDGLEAIRRIREKSTVPVIVLSALGDEADKVKALNIGADDYLAKPFGVTELLARVQAVMRRAHWEPAIKDEDRLIRGEIIADLQGHQVTVRGEPVELTPTEFSLLILLMQNPGKVLSHQAILRQVWGQDYGQETEYLRVYAGRLRQKIEQDPAHPQHLKTEHGIGYCFDAD